jgi:hypothetical protein
MNAVGADPERLLKRPAARGDLLVVGDQNQRRAALGIDGEHQSMI